MFNIAELKRRNVFRVGGLYLIAAWLILQVADTMFSFMEVPRWAGRIVLGILALGFPLALVLAWAFEVTPEGLKRTGELPQDDPRRQAAARRMNLLTIVLAAFAIVFIIVDRMLPTRSAQDSTTTVASSAAPAPASQTTASPAKSVAVIPFINLSSDKEQEYFSDGLSEELLNLLAKIPELRVAARTSSFQFKGQSTDITEIARKLNVAHVLEGSVRKSGNRVRITVQLVNAQDGYHAWSETFERDLDDIFKVQDEIASGVVRQLRVQLLGNAPVDRTKPSNTQAYNLYLQGRYFADRRTAPDLEKAVALYEEALQHDPSYARAWAGLADTHINMGGYGYAPTAESAGKARTAAERALELDANLAEAYVALGRVHLVNDFDWAAADTALKRARELDPGNADIVREAGNVAATLGRLDEAEQLLREALARDPLRAASYNGLGILLQYVGKPMDALAQFRRVLELSPQFASAHCSLARVYLDLGKPEEALREASLEPEEAWRLSALALTYHALGRKTEADASLRDLTQKYADDAAFQIAETHAFRGENDLAIQWLERAYRQRDGGMVQIYRNPMFRGLEQDERFNALLRKLNLIST